MPIIANRNLISTGIDQPNIIKVINVTIGKCIKYIQYEPSDISLNVGLYDPNLSSANPINE